MVLLPAFGRVRKRGDVVGRAHQAAVAQKFTPLHGGEQRVHAVLAPGVDVAALAHVDVVALRGTDVHAEVRAPLRVVPPALGEIDGRPVAAQIGPGRAALDDPAATVRRLADLTERVWHALLAPDWPRHRAVLEADIAHRSRQAAGGGLDALLTGLHPGIGWAGHTLTLRMYGDLADAQRADGRGVLLMPSVFVWPDVVSGFARPWQTTVIYPARGMGGLQDAAAPSPSQALAQLLGHQRAAVLTGLTAPASTTELAPRHGLAPSTVPAHLSVLREAGLLTSRREGHYVLYGRTESGDALVFRAPEAR